MRRVGEKLVVFLEDLGGYAAWYFMLSAIAIITLVAVGGILNLDSVSFDGSLKNGHANIPGLVTKQVGYAYALNWTLAGLTLAASGFFLLRAIGIFPDVVSTMMEKGMFVDRDYGPMQRRLMEQQIETYKRRAVWAAGMIAALMFAFVCWDYLISVFWPLHPDTLATITYQDGNREFDWSVSCGFANAPRSCATTEAFAAVAYLVVPGLMGCLAFGCFLYMTSLAIFTFTTTRRSTYRILPDFTSRDPRRGFEHLEPLFENMTIGIGLSLITIYLMSVQNIYLRVPRSPDIFAYFRTLLNNNIGALNSDGLLDGISKFIGEVGGGKDGTQSTVGLMLSATISFIAGGLFYWSLRASAQDARRIGCGIIEKQEHSATPTERRALVAKRTALQKMKVWPLQWASLSLLMVAGLILTAGVFFPSIVTLVCLAVAYVFIKSLVARYWPKKTETDGAGSGE